MTRSLLIYFVVGLFLLSAGGVILYKVLPGGQAVSIADPNVWDPPTSQQMDTVAQPALLKYGRDLILNTSFYYGPKGIVRHSTNGMNCGNCHLQGGTRYNGNNFSAVASTYPRFRERSGKVESVAFRINDCFERSLNGEAIDTNSKEMLAMNYYIIWLGNKVKKGIKPIGSGTPDIPVLERMASPEIGKNIFATRCMVCHGADGKGKMKADSTGYTYPPLWGDNSYNVSAGMYRLSRLAGFIKNNMPYTTVYSPPLLSDQEAWDVAAYICSNPRPEKFFAGDWPKLSTKPFDFPYGPYVDSFSSNQHKYGPFEPVIKHAKNNTGKK